MRIDPETINTCFQRVCWQYQHMPNTSGNEPPMSNVSNPFILVDTDLFETIPLNHRIQVEEFEPGSKKTCSATFARTHQHFISILYREWSGNRFKLEINLKHGVAQLRAPILTGAPAVDHLTIAVISSCRKLLCRQSLLD